MKRPAQVLLAYATLMAVGQSQNWPSFRGHRASGVAEGHSIPAQWDVDKRVNLKWKTPIAGLSVASPIVWGKQVFVVTAISSEPKNETFRHGLYGDVEPHADMAKHTWKLYSIDAESGNIVWDKVAHEGIETPPKVEPGVFDSSHGRDNGSGILLLRRALRLRFQGPP